ADRGQQIATLLVDRAHPADRVVVLGHAGQPLRGDAAAARDVLQERHDVSGAFRAAERDEQEGVVGRHVSIQPGRPDGYAHGGVWRPGRRTPWNRDSMALERTGSGVSWRSSWPGTPGTVVLMVSAWSASGFREGA